VKDMLTTKQVMALLGVSRRTVQAYVKQKKLTPMKDARGQNFFSQSEVQGITSARENHSEETTFHDLHTVNELSHVTFTVDPKKQIIIDLEHYEGLLTRLAQIESEKRSLQDKIKLLEDRRPWWKRFLAKL
jgi:DNA-binding transcriptional MerR regulator